MLIDLRLDLVATIKLAFILTQLGKNSTYKNYNEAQVFINFKILINNKKIKDLKKISKKS